MPESPTQSIQPVNAKIEASFTHCHEVSKNRAKNFYYGMKLTPEPKRSALYTIYAFMRECDDLADEPLDGRGQMEEGVAEIEASPEIRRERINQFRSQMQNVIDHPLDDLPEDLSWEAFRYVMQTYPIDPAHLHHMLDGQIADLRQHRYSNFDALYQYCYNVASTVGLTCTAIWGFLPGTDMTENLMLAEYRGIALQLTNILRDIAEDAERDRIYLPLDELASYGYAEDDLLGLRVNEAYDRFMKFQIDRAYDYYEKSRTLEQRLTPNCRGTCWAMMRIYRGLLDQIAADPRRVMHERVRLSTPAKLRIMLAAKLKRRY
ncbi:All-trans-phytoene synthase [Poriferisphaera corsica]|uniref:All-trans-phytoene synthase n=1 Tax=Poriferisphaera corsica TaxID=2528020 RepID=A0A517YTD3_9BACT|nr:phytoene/squalene synthase family protein [Poriferisphaera corsica]QDU33488.1 All-trans-phytoene synthase [Poriferisphaera corsica]